MLIVWICIAGLGCKHPIKDNLYLFDMQIYFAIPPISASCDVLEEFFFFISKIQNIYHIDNQLIIFLNLFRDYP